MKKYLLIFNFLKAVRAERLRKQILNEPVHMTEYRYARVMKIRRRAQSGQAWDF